MSKINYFIIFIFLMSCSNKELLNKEEKDYFLELTESRDFILSENENSLDIKIYESKITSKEERKLFSSVIIKEVIAVLDKKRTMKNTIGNNTVFFIDEKGKDSYSITNATVSNANKCYKTLDSLINLTINEKDKMKRFINREVLTEIETDKLIDKWFSIFNLDKKYTVNSYGFIKNKVNLNNQSFDIIELYIQYDETSKREFLKLSFKYNLLIDLTKE